MSQDITFFDSPRTSQESPVKQNSSPQKDEPGGGFFQSFSKNIEFASNAVKQDVVKQATIRNLTPSKAKNSLKNTPKPEQVSHDHEEAPIRKQTFKVRKQIQANQKYAVKFQIQYKTPFGQSLGVIGNTLELGEWKQCKCVLKWNKGHIWTMETPFPISTSHFRYKYVTLYKQSILLWENGIDRIADLSVLPESDETLQGGLSESPVYMNDFQKPKIVELKDLWEMIIIRFTVFTPADGDLDEEVILNNKMAMKRRNRPDAWMIYKYGKEQVPWECRLMVPNTDYRAATGCNRMKVQYGYEIRGANFTVKERMPQRLIEILDPESYTGQLGTQGSTQQFNSDRVFVVNGVIDKCDANFLRPFKASKIGNTGIFVGPYPNDEKDFEFLLDQGIQTVINLTTPDDVLQREIDTEQGKKFYEQYGVKQVIDMPLDDELELDIYSEKLFEAAQQLNSLLTDDHRVFVHCMSGATRSPTLVICYLCLFLKHKNWQNPNDVSIFVNNEHDWSTPNLKVVNKMLREYKQFQDEQIRLKEQEETVIQQVLPQIIQQESKDSADFSLEKEKIERLKLQRIAEEEEAKLEKQRQESQILQAQLKLKMEREIAEQIRLEKQSQADQMRFEREAEEERIKLNQIREDEQKRAQADRRELKRINAENEVRRIQKELDMIDEIANTTGGYKNQSVNRIVQFSRDEDESLFPQASGVLDDHQEADLLGMDEHEVENQCDEIFKDVVIPFTRRKGNDMDKMVNDLLGKLGVTMPVLHIKDNLYLIGSLRLNLELNGDILMIKTPEGKLQKFVEYIPANHRFHEKCLVVHMMRSGQDLEWVVDALFNGRKIKNMFKDFNELNMSRQDKSISEISSVRRRRSVIGNQVQNFIAEKFQKNQSPLSHRKRFAFRDKINQKSNDSAKNDLQSFSQNMMQGRRTISKSPNSRVSVGQMQSFNSNAEDSVIIKANEALEKKTPTDFVKKRQQLLSDLKTYKKIARDNRPQLDFENASSYKSISMRQSYNKMEDAQSGYSSPSIKAFNEKL